MVRLGGLFWTTVWAKEHQKVKNGPPWRTFGHFWPKNVKKSKSGPPWRTLVKLLRKMPWFWRTVWAKEHQKVKNGPPWRTFGPKM